MAQAFPVAELARVWLPCQPKSHDFDYLESAAANRSRAKGERYTLIRPNLRPRNDFVQ